MQRGRHARPDGFDSFPPVSELRRVTCPVTMRSGPSEADLMEIEVGMVRTDVVEDAGNCAPNS